MFRRLFAIFASLSLIAFFAIAALWVSSYRTELGIVRCTVSSSPYVMKSGEILGQIDELHWEYLRSDNGEISFGRAGDERDRPTAEDGWRLFRGTASQIDLPRGDHLEQRNIFSAPIGAHDTVDTMIPGLRVTGAGAWVLRDWIPALICLIFPILWAASRAFQGFRFRRARGGFCATCGYDLRASPGRCPECGQPAIR